NAWHPVQKGRFSHPFGERKATMRLSLRAAAIRLAKVPVKERITPMKRRTLSRRGFLTTASAAALAAPGFAAQGANERINVGLIATGGPCRHLMQALAKVPNVNMAALCDFYEPNLDLTQKLAPKATRTADFRRILANKDIQAVLIATPDHWHVPMTIEPFPPRHA